MPERLGQSDEITADVLGGPRLAMTLARVVVITVFCLIAGLNVLRIVVTPISPGERALAVVYITITLVLQMRFLQVRTKWATGATGRWLLLAQAVLAYVPLLEFKQSWVFMPAFLAGSCLLALRPAWGWTLFGLIVGSEAVIQYLISAGSPTLVPDIVYTTVSTVVTGLVVFGLTRLAVLVRVLHAARDEVARLAIIRERLRVARDLHDLLGYSISAITLKSELTHRLLAKNPERAKEEITDILDISRQALADVRSVASGYRELSLEEEAESARSVLAAANVDVRMELSYDRVPTHVLTLLATVLREAVTNILRHSKAETCEVVVRRRPRAVEIELTNDGVETEQTEPSGNGLRNLSDRLASINGTLEAGVDASRRFRIHATVPLSD